MLNQSVGFHRGIATFLKSILMLSTLALFACSKTGDLDATNSISKDAKRANQENEDQIASVNGQRIARSLFNEDLETRLKSFEAKGRKAEGRFLKDIRNNILRKLVDEALLEQHARALQVGVSSKELDDALIAERGKFASEKAFDDYMARTHQDIHRVKRELKQKLLWEALLEQSGANRVGPEKVRSYYDTHQSRYSDREQYEARHILFKVPRNADSEVRSQIEARAKDVLKKAKRSPSNFAQLAQEFSEGTTRNAGGSLGYFSRGRMVKAFEDAVFASKVGQVIGPIETKFGLHVIQVTGHKDERVKPFEEVRESIQKTLNAMEKSTAKRTLIRKLRSESDVQIFDDDLKLGSPRALQPQVMGGIAAGGSTTGKPSALPNTRKRVNKSKLLDAKAKIEAGTIRKEKPSPAPASAP